MKKYYISDLKEKVEVKLYCWIGSKRHIKDNLFLDIYDSTGVIQAIATKDNCLNYEKLTKLSKESAVCLSGFLFDKNFVVNDYTIIAEAKMTLSPSPNDKNFDVLDPKHATQVIRHPTFYIRNKKLNTIYYLKFQFKQEMRKYFFDKNFVEFESPTLTRQTLYNDDAAIWLNYDNQDISLSRCATFHLEPALMAYEKLFTITNSHSNEKSRTNRHLVEYLHLKVEICWINLEELIDFASDMYYTIANNTYQNNKTKFHEIVDEKYIIDALNKLNPENHIHITYDEAVNILNKKGIDFEYGKSLTKVQEEIITKHFGNNFVWVKFIPYTVEGFMFKRNSDNPFLTQTCDLIAPNGYGEILGCAEKMTDYDEIINSMKEKGKFEQMNRYEDYALLHKFGLPFHGGIGMGIERAFRYICGIEHVKYTKPYAAIKNLKINH